MIVRTLLAAVLLTASLTSSAGQQPARSTALAQTPPMGWNSWNHFGNAITDADVRRTADAMVSSGMRDAGYSYVVIDDTWQGTRDSSGVLHANQRFPDMPALAQYVHSKGLKLGIYSSPGPKTCAGFAGSYGHEEQDARLFAEWGIDYLKYDLCGLMDVMHEKAPDDIAEQYRIMRRAFTVMHGALVKTGRPILYNLCQYGFDAVWEWGSSVGAQSWRTQGDIEPKIDSIGMIGRAQAGLARFAGPGHWNDPDMLEVGNGELTAAENRLHMTLWAMLAAPLIAGNDLAHMSADTRAVLTNREIVALDQDPLGKQAERIFAEGPIEIWSRPLDNGDRAYAVFNFRDSTSMLRGVAERVPALSAERRSVHELWTGRSMESPADLLREPLPGYSVRVIRVSVR